MSLGEKSAIEQETFSPGDFFFHNVSISTLKDKDLGAYLGEGEGGEEKRGWVLACQKHCKKTAVNKITKLIII